MLLKKGVLCKLTLNLLQRRAVINLRYHSAPRIRLPVMMAFVFSIVSNSAYAFKYTSYEHFSSANCSIDREAVPPIIQCDIPTGDDARIPTKLSGVILYSSDFEGRVKVCARNLETGLTLCSGKNSSKDGKVVFDTSDLRFNWQASEVWKKSSSPWWNWVLFLELWDTTLSVDTALKGYRVFYDIQ